MEKLKKPDFLIIGAQKCATTWTRRKLEEHPKICFLTYCDNYYFTRLRGVGDSEQKSKYEKFGLNKYRELLKEADQSKLVGDSATAYLYDKSLPKKLNKYFRNLKLLVFLRNPIERTYSQYKGFPSRKERFGSFQDAINKEEGFIERSLYGKYIENYLNYFSKEQIIFCFFEDIKRSPLEFIQNLYADLGVDSDFVPGGVYQKENTRKEKDMWAFRNRLEKSFFLKKLMTLTKKLNLYPYCKKVVKMLLPKDTISKKQARELYRVFKDDIKKVEKITGRDLSHWKEK